MREYNVYMGGSLEPIRSFLSVELAIMYAKGLAAEWKDEPAAFPIEVVIQGECEKAGPIWTITG